VDPADSDRVRETMQEFDSNATEGSRLLLAGPTSDTERVDDVRQWATEQSARLSELKSTIPAQDKADESLALLNRLLGETGGLQDVCDPTAADCPDVTVTDPVQSGATADQDDTPSGTSGSRTTTRNGAGGTDDDADDPSADDEQAPSGSTSDDDRSGTDRSRNDSGSGGSGSGGSGGTAGGGSTGSGGGLPLPLDVSGIVPNLLPGGPLG
jgi:hypothetical protein